MSSLEGTPDGRPVSTPGEATKKPRAEDVLDALRRRSPLALTQQQRKLFEEQGDRELLRTFAAILEARQRLHAPERLPLMGEFLQAATRRLGYTHSSGTAGRTSSGGNAAAGSSREW
jgi:hypothetical protein